MYAVMSVSFGEKKGEQIHRLISTVDFLVSIALVTASLVDNNKSCFSVRKSKALHSLRLYLLFSCLRFVMKIDVREK